MTTAQASPMQHHATLRKRKREENTHRVEIDQQGGIAFKDNEENACQNCQAHNTEGEGQAIATEGELVRQEVIARQQRGQAREIGVTGIGRQCKDQQSRHQEDRKHKR